MNWNAKRIHHNKLNSTTQNQKEYQKAEKSENQTNTNHLKPVAGDQKKIACVQTKTKHIVH